MPERSLLLFCEDRGHETFVRALVARLAREQGVSVAITPINAVGGKGRAISSLRDFQRRFWSTGHARPIDLLVLVIDSNSMGWSEMKGSIGQAIEPGIWPNHVIGCPEPHIERWCFADPVAFHEVTGRSPPKIAASAERKYYKTALDQAIRESGIAILTGPLELAAEFINRMDWVRVSRTDRSLSSFVTDLSKVMRTWIG